MEAWSFLRKPLLPRAGSMTSGSHRLAVTEIRRPDGQYDLCLDKEAAFTVPIVQGY